MTPEQQEALGRMILEGFRTGDADVVEGCLKRGANPDVIFSDPSVKGPRPLLHWAAANFNEAAMAKLLDYGANIDIRDSSGNSALHFALSQSRADAIEYLMARGADPLAQNDNGTVALEAARSLRSDYDYYVQIRTRIIKAMTADYGAPQPPKPPATETSGPPPAAVKLDAPQAGARPGKKLNL